MTTSVALLSCNASCDRDHVLPGQDYNLSDSLLHLKVFALETSTGDGVVILISCHPLFSLSTTISSNISSCPHLHFRFFLTISGIIASNHYTFHLYMYIYEFNARNLDHKVTRNLRISLNACPRSEQCEQRVDLFKLISKKMSAMFDNYLFSIIVHLFFIIFLKNDNLY